MQEGWEKGFYTPDEARIRIAGYQGTIARAEAEIGRLREQMENRGISAVEAELLREQFGSLRGRNLRQAAFEEKADMIAMLGVRVYPAKDLKSRRITCRLNLCKMAGDGEQGDFTKVMLGGRYCTIRRTKTFEITSN